MVTSVNNPSVEQVLFDASTGTQVTDYVTRVMQLTPAAPTPTAIGDSFYGINHRQTPGAININRDYNGLTFFTRPALNLSSENLRMVRQFGPLLTKQDTSIQRIIRCWLDPNLARDYKGASGVRNAPMLTSPFVDDDQAFIPFLTNHLMSMGGWPDIEAPTFSSHEGVYREVFSQVDGIVQNYGTYDITANFRNVPGDPISLMFLIWLHYMGNVYLGDMVPYPEYIIENMVDYNTRIYRLILDSTKTKVQKIAACGAAFPLTCPIGNAFNFDYDKPLNQANDQLSVTFRCMGALYQDDILIDEFNRTSIMFNSNMGDQYRSQYYQKVPISALAAFNNRGYPRINPDTYELEWWVSKDEWQYRYEIYQEQQQLYVTGNAQ